MISLFQHKEYIWLFAALAVLLILFVWLLRWKKGVRKKIGSPQLVNALTAGYSGRLFIGKFIIVLLALAAGIIAAMNPRKPGSSENTSRKGIDVAIALDVSKSMLAADMAPSRLERAKQFITKLMDQMPNDRIALVLFAGKAYMQMPLTTDHGAAAMYVNTAGPDAIPQQGTVISDALQISAAVFNSTEKRFKTIVLISDGEDHDESAVKTATDLAAEGVMVNTIGVGSPDGAVIIDPATGAEKKDEAGNTVISKLNETTLKEVAAETNGIYLRLQSSDEAVSLLNAQLAQIDRKAFGDISLMSFKTYYAWFAGIMLCLLLIESLLPETKKNRVKKTCSCMKYVLSILIIITCGELKAQQADQLIAEGNEWYRTQQYEKAAASYTKASNAAPADQVAKFNLANTLHRQGKDEQAIQLYTEVAAAADNATLKAKAFYNKGAVLSKQQKLEESIAAYKDALRNNPADTAARENLQKALLELKKKNPPKKKQDDQQKKKKPEEKQKQQQIPDLYFPGL